MLKKLAFGGIGLVLLATPLFTSALTLQETITALQTQLQTIMAQIDAILAGTGGTTGGTTGATTGGTTGGTAGGTADSSCVLLYNTISIGSRDADNDGEVTTLQLFLVGMGPSIYPEALVTGYFGSATQRAVQRFQAAQGIVSSGTPSSTGYGLVGPSTRARIAEVIGCGENADDEETDVSDIPDDGTPPHPSVTVAVSSSTVTATYANIPSNSYIEIVGLTTGNVQRTMQPSVPTNGATTTNAVPEGTYFLRVRQAVSGGANPVVVQSATFAVGGTPPHPSVNVVVSGSTVTATYADFPQNSYLQLVNQANGNVAQGFGNIPPDPGISGSGARAINSIPAGIYYLRVQRYVDGTDPAVAQSRSFTVGAAAAQTCSQQNEMQICANGAYAARIGANCTWAVCPYSSASGPSITINGASSGNPPDISIPYGSTTPVSWSVTPTVGTTCMIFDGATTTYNQPLSFSGNIGPYYSTRNFSMTCSNSTGVTGKTLRINVGAQNSTTTTATDSSASTVAAPNTYIQGQSGNQIWENILAQFNAEHTTRFGIPMNRPWNADSDAMAAKAVLDAKYRQAVAAQSSGSGTSTTTSTAARPGPTVDLTQSVSSSYDGQFFISWSSANADSCKIAFSKDGLTFTDWKSGTSGNNVSTYPQTASDNRFLPTGGVGNYVIRATCTGNGTPAVDKIYHSVLPQRQD